MGILEGTKYENVPREKELERKSLRGNFEKSKENHKGWNMEQHGLGCKCFWQDHPSKLGPLSHKPNYSRDQQENQGNPECEHLDAPREGVYKLNFDGASKGNPGPLGYGFIIRDSRGSLVGFGSGYIGWETNNVAEIEGLLQGISMLKEEGWFPSIIEGDSKVVIQMEIKLQNGSQSLKVAQS